MPPRCVYAPRHTCRRWTCIFSHPPCLQDDPTFFPGRHASVLFRGQRVGQFGIIHPEVLAAFDIVNPGGCGTRTIPLGDTQSEKTTGPGSGELRCVHSLPLLRALFAFTQPRLPPMLQLLQWLRSSWIWSPSVSTATTSSCPPRSSSGLQAAVPERLPSQLGWQLTSWAPPQRRRRGAAAASLPQPPPTEGGLGAQLTALHAAAI